LKNSTVYIETTILSYLASIPSRDIIVQAHQQITWEWWNNYRKNYDLYISPIVIQEISRGDIEASKKRKKFINNISILQISDNITELALKLIKFLGLPKKAELDALHLAFAIDYSIDYLLTWNCNHLANGVFIKKLKQFESKESRVIPVILTPEELMTGGKENEME